MSGVTFERLPPERRITAPTAASAGSCCCCCCCCLHTVGSLVGALTAKPPKATEAVPTAVVGTAKVAPQFRVTKEYWVTVLILCTVAVPFYVFSMTRTQIVEPLEWAFFYAIFFPAIQLVASLAVLVRNGFSKRPGREERMRHLGSITARAFVGGLIGILVMVIAGGLLAR
jgi:hypothetical protein